MQQISCERCENPVLVERYTEQQVSVQWMGDAEQSCPEFARQAQRGTRSSTLPTCRALRSTIELKIRANLIRLAPRTVPVARRDRVEGSAREELTQ